MVSGTTRRRQTVGITSRSWILSCHDQEILRLVDAARLAIIRSSDVDRVAPLSCRAVSDATAVSAIQRLHLTSWLLRDHLSVFPVVERRAVHTSDFPGIFGGETQAAQDTGGEIFGLA